MGVNSYIDRVAKTVGAAALGGAMCALAVTGAQAADWSMKDEPAPGRSLEWSFEAGATTDYVFRGESQSDEDGAVFGGLELAYGMFYVGTWASGVEFGDGTNYELNLYGGIKQEYRGIEFDLGVIYYLYPTAPSGADYDFVEFKAGASGKVVGDVTLGLTFYFSPDYFGGAGETLATEGTVTVPLPAIMDSSWELSGTLGYLEFFDDSSSSFAYWNVGISKTIAEHFTFDVRYWGREDAGCGYLCDDRVVGTLTIAN